MEILWLKALLDSISRFSLSSSSCNNITSEPVRKYYQKIDEALEVLRPVLDEIVDSEIASDEHLSKALEEMDAFVNEARELIESWHQMMSKVYFVLQIESTIAKIQTSGSEICRIVDSLLQSLADGSNTAFVQNHIQKIQCTECEKSSDAIEEAMHDLQEDATPNSETLSKIADTLNLRSNQELLLEAVALEMAKSNRDRNDGEAERIDNMISLVTHMHDSLMKVKQSQTVNGVLIPADFCCPLSLELMSDPVIVASGQTYERAFIRRWLNQGLMVCPKTRQTLAHTNLIPNYTVKALIANWCEINNIKLPDPMKSVTLNQPLALLAHPDGSTGDSHILPHMSHASRTNHPRSPESIQSMNLHKSFTSSNGAYSNNRPVSPSRPDSCMEGTLVSRPGASLVAGNGVETDIIRVSQVGSGDAEVISEEQDVGSAGQTSAVDEQSQGHNRTASAPSVVSSSEYHQGAGDASEGPPVSGDLMHYSSDTSGELTSEAPAPSAPRREPEFSSRLSEMRSTGSQIIWPRPQERLVPRIVSSSSLDMRPDLSGGAGDASDGPPVSGDLTHYSSDTSGELTSEAPAPSAPRREPEFSPRLSEMRSTRSQIIWPRPLERLVPRIISSPSLDMRPDLSGVEAQVRNLIEDLESSSADVLRAATHELRLLAKHNMDNRIVIANCGAITHLVRLLHSTDLKTQENAVTALLNLSINDNNKMAIADAGAIEPLIHVLKIGNAEAKENSAATLFSLSVIETNKVKIGRSGAVEPLVELLGNGTPRGKKDAATALFNLSIFHENKLRIVDAGAVKYLVELMDPAAGMVDKAVAVLANLSTIQEGRTAIGQEGGIPVLVEVVELGSSRGKENAAAALLQLCTNSNRFCTQVLQEGAVPPLVALSQSGTPRAREKAQHLLTYFRQRHGNAARS